MRKSSKWLLVAVGALAFVGLSIASPEVEARPSYPKMFVAKYKNLEDQVATVKCGVCHPVMNKKVRNDYGKALEAALGETKNAKEDTFGPALEKAAESKNADGKTFGELIKEGKLPK